jgi:hypothetical protein
MIILNKNCVLKDEIEKKIKRSSKNPKKIKTSY